MGLDGNTIRGHRHLRTHRCCCTHYRNLSYMHSHLDPWITHTWIPGSLTPGSLDHSHLDPWITHTWIPGSLTPGSLDHSHLDPWITHSWIPGSLTPGSLDHSHLDPFAQPGSLDHSHLDPWITHRSLDHSHLDVANTVFQQDQGGGGHKIIFLNFHVQNRLRRKNAALQIRGDIGAPCA